MNEEIRFELDLMQRKINGFWAVAGVLAALAIGLLIWNLIQVSATDVARERQESLAASLDSLRALQLVESSRRAGIVERVDALEKDIATKAETGAVSALQGRLGVIGRQLARADSVVTESGDVTRRRLNEITVAIDDSLTVLRYTMDAGLTRVSRDLGSHDERLALVDRHLEAIERRQQSGAWKRSLRDVLTIVNTGVLLPHVLDHENR